MKKHHLLGVILLCSGLFSCSSGVIQQANYEVIPLPQEIKITTGSFVLNDRTSIVYPKDNKEMQQNANLLAKYIHQMSGKKLKVIDEPVTSNAIILATGLNADNAEAYQLKSNPRQRNHHRYFRSRNFLWHTDFTEVTPNYKQRRHKPSCCRN